MMTTQKQVRRAFWEYRRGHQPEEIVHTSKRQNEQPADIRVDFVDYVDWLVRDGDISEALAARVTL